MLVDFRIRNPRNLLLMESRIWEICCLWNPESGKFVACGFQNPGNLLLVESRIQEICCLWIPESGKFVACGIRNPGNLLLVDSRILEICCLWNPEYRKFVACGFGENCVCGIWNPGLWYPEYRSMNPESHLRLKARIHASKFKIH